MKPALLMLCLFSVSFSNNYLQWGATRVSRYHYEFSSSEWVHSGDKDITIRYEDGKHLHELDNRSPAGGWVHTAIFSPCGSLEKIIDQLSISTTRILNKTQFSNGQRVSESFEQNSGVGSGFSSQTQNTTYIQDSLNNRVVSTITANHSRNSVFNVTTDTLYSEYYYSSQDENPDSIVSFRNNTPVEIEVFTYSTGSNGEQITEERRRVFDPYTEKWKDDSLYVRTILCLQKKIKTKETLLSSNDEVQSGIYMEYDSHMRPSAIKYQTPHSYTKSVLSYDDNVSTTMQRGHSNITGVTLVNTISNNLKIESGVTGDFSVIIFDVMGRSILRDNVTLTNGTNVYPLKRLPAGSYIVKLSNGQKTISQRIFSR
ncbi:hypothetical protein CHISP_0554 [Chitinispirillum alkaliphilum]|nr:hypothetical protein CHISP_0554 [Chitinispirillum alkaliphilum]